MVTDREPVCKCADEIKRLKDKIKTLKLTREYWPHNAEADAVIKYREEQLAEANASIRRLNEAYAVAVKIVSEQGAELAKFKSALIAVVAAYKAGDETQHLRMIEIAQEALGFNDE